MPQPSSPDRRPWRQAVASVDRGLMAVIGVFVVSRLLAHAAGLRFDDSTLEGYFQYLDPQLLRADLVDSIWHLHVQPPLYNAFLGLALKATGGDPAGLLHALHLLTGLVLAVATYRLLRRFETRGPVAATVTCVLTVLPATLLYEHWLYATYPAAALVVLTALFLHRWSTSGRRRDLAVALAMFTVLVLTRSLFHPVLLLVIVGGLAWLHREQWRTIVAMALAPVLVVSAVLAHQVAVFDVPPMSASCGGFSLARSITWQLTEAEREELIAQGVLSDLAMLTPAEITAQRPDLLTATPPTGSRAMDDLVKSTGAPNFNHRGFLEVCAQYAADAMATASSRPVALARGQTMAWLTYFRSTSDFRFFSPQNRDSLAGWERLTSLLAGQVAEDDWDYWRDGGWPVPLGPRLLGVAWGVVALFAVVIPASTVRLVRRIRRQRRSPTTATQAFLLLVVAWVTFVGNPVDVGENNRFRFLVNAPVAVLAIDLWASASYTSTAVSRIPSRGGPSTVARSPTKS